MVRWGSRILSCENHPASFLLSANAWGLCHKMCRNVLFMDWFPHTNSTNQLMSNMSFDFTLLHITVCKTDIMDAVWRQVWWYFLFLRDERTHGCHLWLDSSPLKESFKLTRIWHYQWDTPHRLMESLAVLLTALSQTDWTRFTDCAFKVIWKDSWCHFFFIHLCLSR